MKKVVLFVALGLTIISCNKSEVKEVKTAYVDTQKLIEESTESKDIEGKYKAKYDEMGAKLQEDIKRFQADAANFEQEAKMKGMIWAQQNASGLQQRKQQLAYQQNLLDQKIREESGVAMDSLVSSMKKTIKAYGKEKGYAYIYEGNSVLYSDEKNDITKDIVKLINDKYKAAGKKDETAEAKAEPAKEEKK